MLPFVKPLLIAEVDVVVPAGAHGPTGLKERWTSYLSMPEPPLLAGADHESWTALLMPLPVSACGADGGTAGGGGGGAGSVVGTLIGAVTGTTMSLVGSESG